MNYTRPLLWLIVAATVLTGAAACVSPPEYPDEPVIEFAGLSKPTIYQFTNGPRDSVTLSIDFTDGDGDLSIVDSTDIFLRSSQFDEITLPINLPEIPREGTGNGISGTIEIDLINTALDICCIRMRGSRIETCIEDAGMPTDTVSFSIQVRDRAGNRSNVVRTEPITILCLGQ